MVMIGESIPELQDCIKDLLEKLAAERAFRTELRDWLEAEVGACKKLLLIRLSVKSLRYFNYHTYGYFI